MTENNVAAQAGDEPMLPKPFGDIDIYEDSGRVRSVDGYTAEQMRAYRAAAQVSPRATADVEREKLEKMLRRIETDLMDVRRTSINTLQLRRAMLAAEERIREYFATTKPGA